MVAIEFVFISVVVAIIDVIIALMAFSHRKRTGRSLGMVMLMAAGVDISYMISVMAGTYFLMSFCSSIYFCFVDLMLLAFLFYISNFTELYKGLEPVKIAAVCYAVFDMIVLMFNAFSELALTYAETGNTLVKWKYVPFMLFRMHLFYSYSLLVIAAVLLGIKLIIVPWVYRGRYINIIWGVAVIVLINAIFLFIPSINIFDVSIFLYSAIGAYMYWNNFSYSEKRMLHKTREMIVNDMGRAIVMFDYEDRFAMCNKLADSIIPREKQVREYTLDAFLNETSISKNWIMGGRENTFQWVREERAERVVYRCDYKEFRNKRKATIGKLFMFTDTSTEVDLLTGFHTKDSFYRTFGQSSNVYMDHTCVAVCDLNRLSHINYTLGNKMGDHAIRTLANLMWKHFPKGTYFVRLEDANLMAICLNAETMTIRIVLDEIGKELAASEEFPERLEMQSAICEVTPDRSDIIQVSRIAVSSMKTRKMLDRKSAHSSLLDSLTQMQLENDDETEAHVRRTQRTGEKLGERLGLSDQEQSSLALLCLLHDIGKVGIPLEILNKPGKLNDEEWVVMKSHVEKGYHIAKASPELESIADMIRHHHEAWDGGGYPDHLKGEDIPLLSRIIAVVDSFDAMTHDRPYRKAMKVIDAVKELERCAGRQFDPYLVEEFVKILREEFPALWDEDYMEGLAESVKETGKEDKNARHTIADLQEKYQFGNLHQTESVEYVRYILDSQEHILYPTDQFVQLTGYSKEYVAEHAMTQYDLIFPEDLEEYRAMISEQISRNHEAYVLHRIRRMDGSAIRVLCYGKNYFDSAVRENRSEILVVKIGEEQYRNVRRAYNPSDSKDPQ